jgi:predicted secreted protein
MARLNDAKFIPADPNTPHDMTLEINGVKTVLWLREADAKPDPACPGAARRMFTLTATVPNGKVAIQDDDGIPITRRCATGYEITGAFAQGDRIAVAIRVAATPPLGARYRFIIATGKLPVA